ncbi:MAG TPA: hypothetical protein VE872_00360 [Candidatus Bathyarchaeia archaeon]|nr:hypothetical protein [Candidatus Bathyarchaeia archaeon]
MLDRPDRAFVAALVAIGAAYASLFGYYFLAVMIRRPYLDMFHYIMDYLDYPRTGGFLHYLWSQYLYSEHRQIWMRLLTAADVGVFQGVAYPFLVVDTMAVAALPVLIGREVSRAGLPPTLGVTAVWATVMLTLTTANVADCSIPIEGIYPQTLFFAVLSLVLFVGDEESGRTAALYRVGAIIAAIGAGLASAVGLIIWPILAWAAWRGSSGWRWTAAVVAVAAVFIAFYTDGLVLFGLNAAITGDRQFYSSRHLLDAADALIAFLGLPWTRAPALAVAGRALGAGLLLAGSFVVAHRGFLSLRCGRLERIGTGLIMFSLATAGFAAVGRVGSQWQGIWPVRYALFLAPLHLGLLCLALPWLKERWASRHGRRLTQAAALSFGAVMLVQQVAAGQAGARESQALNAAIAEFMATGREPAIRQVLWDNLAQTQHVVDEMRRRQLYLSVN